MEIAQHIEALRTEGHLLAAAAERTTLDARLPTCPRWRIRGLLRHVGMVHRWAAAHVSGTRNDNFDPFKELIRKWPADAALLAWFRDGHAALVGALESAPPDLKCFTFLPAPSALAFWARRQAHETGIHRADAEVPGGAVTPYPAAVARDGIDELLFGFLSRPKSGLTADSPRTLHIHATDTTGEWLLRIGPNGPEIAAEHAEADCTISGTASDLYLLVWNRRALDGLSVAGDPRSFAPWRKAVHIRWR